MHKRHARLVASAAATVISLACGTNYVYSAWAPQFAERLRLSATQSNVIGLSGNLGMYLLGVPVGVLVDRRGPRPFVLTGAMLLFVGYFCLYRAYQDTSTSGLRSSSVPASGSSSILALAFCSFLSGLGSCMAFAAAVKTSALNWPANRGTATAFPLAAFGLSAFFFSSLGALVFPGHPGAFLRLLAYGTLLLIALGFFFLNVHPHDMSPQALMRPVLEEPGTSTPGRGSVDETSSLVSSSSGAQGSLLEARVDQPLDVRGMRLLRSHSFWLLFSIMALLAGVGLMTINNIGNNVNVLWRHRDPSVTRDFLVQRQQMHVSIISICSFVARLVSGVGSDYMVSIHVSRLWCLVAACLIFVTAQVCALSIHDPHLLSLVSILSGLGYGFLFGVFPSLVSEAFGIRGFSQNWGFITLAPVVSSNAFNIFYGFVYDKHSVIEPNGQRSCHDGLACYRAAYWVTLGACSAVFLIILRTFRHERLQYARLSKRLPD
ncbi:hypothetical protein CDD81_4184 [Ophiocordyceps australis]|uniref:Nodulin-like domain-containing protein n=1 Tax=Ophiocordyceps australis TaxID=1399860 RepID=A0A2C5XDS3_9HYPO|nr:hypothetical protein CDD81_4184 [Ophiocordyceps australis]